MKEIKMFEVALARLDEYKKVKDTEEGDKIYNEVYDSLAGYKCTLFNKYVAAKERGNEFIDLPECPCEDAIPEFVDCIRECGIDRITISSGWSGLVERMWIFVQCGCEIEGMVEVNSFGKNYETGEYEKMPAFLLAM